MLEALERALVVAGVLAMAAGVVMVVVALVGLWRERR